MKTITLTDQDGSKITGRIPEGWHQVPLSAFMDYHTQLQDKPKGMEAAVMVAVLTDLPAEALASDVSLVPMVLRLMPWCDALPEPVPFLLFTHQGESYEHVGNLEKVDTAQFEALLSFIEEAKGDPVAAAPNLLAVLYKDRKRPQTKESVSAAAEAFKSLPMDKAWSALAFFLTSSQPLASRIHACSQSHAAAMTMLQKIEQVTAGASPTRSSRIAAWLVRRFTSSVRVLLMKSWKTWSGK